MRVGLCAYNMPAGDLLDLAVNADRAGFDSLWLGEHVLLPVGYTTAHPTTGTASKRSHSGPVVGADTVLVDPLIELAAIAARTRRIGLGTAMLILPLRDPLLLARAACTIQQLSGGRLQLGAGSGWLKEEFDALGIDFTSRGSRFTEMIEILRRAWGGGPFSFTGQHFDLEQVQITPEPVAVPLVYAGNTERALRRAATEGDGWFASGIPSFEEALRLRDRILALRAEGRPGEPLRTVFRLEGSDPDAVRRYAREGLDDVAVWADRFWEPGGDTEANRSRLDGFAAALGLAPVAA